MLYKVLNENGTPCHGGNGTWSLPTLNEDGAWIPGKWMPAIEGELVPCENGYHLCRDVQVLDWLGPALFEAEYRGEVVEAGDKVVVREARLLRRLETWNDRTARLFACDCAERVLPLFEGEHPADTRPREAIETARRYANGEATVKELAAARVAAGAARYAVKAGAWDAWDARYAVKATTWAAGGVAWDAAGDATWDAAGDARYAVKATTWATRAATWATWDAEREWQYARLCEYLDGRL